jgi:hypothetical protein
MRAKTIVFSSLAAIACAVALRFSLAGKPPAPPPEPATPAIASAPASPAPSPPSRPAAPAPAEAARTRGPSASAGGEADLMAALRADLKTNPARALFLAREAEARYGETPHAAERGHIAIEALVRLDRIAEARDEAEPFIRKYAGTDHARAVENLTGVHPRPSGPSRGRPDQPGGSSP